MKYFYLKNMDELKKDQKKLEEKQETDEEKIEIAEEDKKKKKVKSIRGVFIYSIMFLIISFILFSNKILISDERGSFLDRLPIIGQIKFLVESSDKKLKNEDSGRINVLLLGIGGKKHEGGLLTDTIMLASLDVKNKKAALLSVPRDLSIPVEGSSDWAKINSINAFAEVKEENSGGIAISQALGDVLDIPIDYYIRIDFEGFVNIINKLGGIEIYVENTLDDYSYPVSGKEEAEDYNSRFEYLHIDKGWQKMDGELALKYARSRHAVGIEGSDFSRAARQQKIIQAAKDKILKTNFLIRPDLITGIIGELKDNISTNLKVWEIIKLWDISKDVKKENISTKVLDNSPNGLLYNIINEKGAYVLLPRSGDFEEIKYFVNNIFDQAPIGKKEEVITEMATLEIKNGTWVNGLAGQSAVDMEKYGFNVIRISNSSRRNFEKSIIYDLTFGEKINSLSVLKEKTKASVSFDIPQWLKDEITNDLNNEENAKKPDFIIILGQDADSSNSGTENTEK